MQWRKDVDAVPKEAKESDHTLLIDFSAAPGREGCVWLKAESYADPEVSAFINETFVPVEIHIKENPTGFHRFDVLWTPSVLIMDLQAKERVRNEGYLPKGEFRPWLEMTLTRLAFVQKQWVEAEERFSKIVRQFPDSGVAAYSIYWRAVSRYKKTQDHSDLSAVTQEFKRRSSGEHLGQKSCGLGALEAPRGFRRGLRAIRNTHSPQKNKRA